MKLQQLRYAREVARRGPERLGGGRGPAHLAARRLASRSRSSRTSSAWRSSCATASASPRSPSPGSAVLAIAERILAGGGEPEARGRGVREREARARSPSPPRTRRRATRCPRRWPRSSGAIPEVQLRHPPGQPDADLRDGAARRGRHRHRHRGDRRATRSCVSLPCYQWNRCVVVPRGHPLLKAKPLTLEAIARYPIVTYDFAFANRSLIDKAFEQRGLAAQGRAHRARLRT